MCWAGQRTLTVCGVWGEQYTLAQKGGGANTQFVPELDRNYLEFKSMKRQFADSSQVPTPSLLPGRAIV